MPYIGREDRNNPHACQHKPGVLNYNIHQLIFQYLDHNGLSYTTINEVLGVLNAVNQEFYRRVAVPYEEEKRQQNGDVYPKELTNEKDAARYVSRRPGDIDVVTGDCPIL